MIRVIFIILFALLSLSSPYEVGAYNSFGLSWAKKSTSFYTNGNQNSLWNDAFEAALAEWNNLSNFTYYSIDAYADPCLSGYAPKNSWAFSDTNCDVSFGTNTLAVTTIWSVGDTITETDILFNNAENWNVYSGKLWWNTNGEPIFDFKRVAVHELGHALGLDHEDTYPAIMNTTYGQYIETPQSDDINGLRAIYGGSGAPNQPPNAQIISPKNGAAYYFGDTIYFSGNSYDNEDGYLYGNALVWSSSKDGNLGTGSSINRDNLSVGTHTITFTATDYDGASGSSSITVAVNNPIPPLSAAPSVLNIDKGSTGTITITGGSTPYAVSSNDTSIATVSLSGNTVTVTGQAEGPAVVTITDDDFNSIDCDITVNGSSEKTCASFDMSTNTLHIPCLVIGSTYWADLQMIPGDPITLQLIGIDENQTGDADTSGECASFNMLTGILHIPCLKLGASYWADLQMTPGDPVTFQLIGIDEN